MNIDVEKIKSYPVLRVKFPSRNKANKFIRALVNKHGYTIAEPWLEEIKRVGKDDTLLLIYKNSLIPTKLELQDNSTISYSEFILPDVKVQPIVEPEHKIKGLPFMHGGIHYLTSDITDSDLALRYYIQFDFRPNYVGKWFVKCKKTKQYLEVTKEQAKWLAETMTKDGFRRVIGFREHKGFKRIIIKGDDLNVTLNNKLCMVQPIKIKEEI